MFDKSLLLFSAGIRAVKKTLVDGNEHTLHFRVKTPQEITMFLGSERRYAEDYEGDLMRDKKRAEFITSSMCDEAGDPLLTLEQAMQIPSTLKPELCQMIVTGSNTPGTTGKT